MRPPQSASHFPARGDACLVTATVTGVPRSSDPEADTFFLIKEICPLTCFLIFFIIIIREYPFFFFNLEDVVSSLEFLA